MTTSLFKAALLFALLLTVTGAPLVHAEDEAAEGDAFEDSLFGGSNEADEDDEDDEDEFFGSGAEMEPLPLLDSQEDLFGDRLTIGGLLQLRYNMFTYEHVPLDESPVNNPNLFDLYFDARPNDRLRGFVQFRYESDPSLRTSDETEETFVTNDITGSTTDVGNEDWLLDQMWLKFDVSRKVFFTIGRQRIKYGAARFFNPTDFVNKVQRDPLAFFDERTGVDLVRVQIPVESLGWNFYALLDVDGVDRFGDYGGTVRGEFVFGRAETSLTAQVRRDDPLRLGWDISAGVGPFDLYAEVATRYDDRSRYWEGDFDATTLTLPTVIDRSDEWITEVVVGGEYSFNYNNGDDIVYIGAEYFHNSVGYEDAELYPITVSSGDFDFLASGEHYGAFFVLLPAPYSWDLMTFSGSYLANFADESGIVRLDWRMTLLTYLNLDLYAAKRVGEVGGEFRLAFDIPPVGFVPGLEQGFVTPAPDWDFGVRLAVAF